MSLMRYSSEFQAATLRSFELLLCQLVDTALKKVSEGESDEGLRLLRNPYPNGDALFFSWPITMNCCLRCIIEQPIIEASKIVTLTLAFSRPWRLVPHVVRYPLVLLMLMCAYHSGAQDQPKTRYALVIGNQSYEQAPLRNPIADATAIATKLDGLGFKVTRALDTTLADLDSAISSFYRSIPRKQQKNTVALIYYAGHAVQLEGRNYLVPLGASYTDPKDFIAGLYNLNALFQSIPLMAELQNIVILDSCRNNPFSALGNMIDDGLAPLKAPAGTLIAFATEPGSAAMDGRGKNGVYTKHLLKHIQRPIPVEEVFKRVRRGVTRETRKRQIPWENSSLLNDTFINPPKNRQIPELVTF